MGVNKTPLQFSVESIDHSKNSAKVIGYQNGKNIKIDSALVAHTGMQTCEHTHTYSNWIEKCIKP